ncbi:hypothetical protein E2K93_15940 [Thalassotalea sp. HSM 43]|uniref:hypothetical protein n=1 Tax=Thalassotalea sp. HSM 43 TaxID=2552945 RepID=UPI0010822189|nr:hypothetical protein [Thalassotalea sp. HSM 43]QBY05760.1 hypothetical protein E2K93_15940 [Thalassotalea sp. HSM 43]
MNNHTIVSICCLMLMFGCSSTPPKDAFKLEESSLESRQMQSRKFDNVDRETLLLATGGVLQDLGYLVEESDSSIGVLSAQKDIDASRSREKAAAFIIAMLTGSMPATDDIQSIRICLVVYQDLNHADKATARITMQRIVRNTQGIVTTVEIIDEPELYQSFFEKLSKSLFLEEGEI